MSVKISEKINNMCCYSRPVTALGDSQIKHKYFFGPCYRCGGNHIQDRAPPCELYNHPPLQQSLSNFPSHTVSNNVPVCKYFEFICNQLPAESYHCPATNELFTDNKTNELKRNGLNESDHQIANWLASCEGMEYGNCCKCMDNNILLNHTAERSSQTDDGEIIEEESTVSISPTYTQESSTNTQIYKTNSQSTQCDELFLDYWTPSIQCRPKSNPFHPKKNQQVMVIPRTKCRGVLAKLPYAEYESLGFDKRKPKLESVKRKLPPRICLFCNPLKVDKCL